MLIPPKHESTPIRRDIQCLRGVAVILVVLYHLGVPYFSGGFIGVDIFLVISGYLVVGSVLKDHLTHKKPSFSFAAFFSRRSRRLLLPSAACLISILMALIFFPSADFEGSLLSIAYSSFSLANIHFYSHSTAYFATDLGHTLTLHYWSLGLEEQFFFVFPLIIMGFFWAYNHLWHSYPTPKATTTFIATTAALSFVSCFIVSDNAKFFLVPFRVWEFLIGALVWLYEHHAPSGMNTFPRQNPIIPVALVASLFFLATFMSGNSYPNLWTLLITALSAAFLMCQNSDMNFPVLEYMGNLSYSIYLYHWPIIRFINLSFVHHTMLHKDLVYYCTNLFLFQWAAWLSYHYIENPSKKLDLRPKTWLFIFLITATSISFASVIISTIPPAIPVVAEHPNAESVLVPFEQDQGRVQKLIDNQRAAKVWEFDNPLYKAGEQRVWEQGDPQRCVLLLGDSHAMMYSPVLRYFAKKHNLTLWVDAEPAVSTLPDGWRQYFVRDKFPFVPKAWEACPRKMIFMASLSGPHNFTSYHESLDYVLQFGCVVQTVTIYYPDIEPVPCVLDGKIQSKSVSLEECVNSKIDKPWELYEGAVPNRKGLNLLNILDKLCPKVPCKVYEEEIPKYKDRAHLSRVYMEYLAPHIDQVMSEYECVKNVIN